MDLLWTPGTVRSWPSFTGLWNGGRIRLSEYSVVLCYTSANSLKRAQKLAKKLLRKYRTSLLLYSAYAQIEWRMGNIDAARKVFSTALGMCGSSPEDGQRDGIHLWRTWTWEEIMDGNLREALSVLLSIPDGKFSGDNGPAFSKAARLRAKRVSFQTMVD